MIGLGPRVRAGPVGLVDAEQVLLHRWLPRSVGHRLHERHRHGSTPGACNPSADGCSSGSGVRCAEPGDLAGVETDGGRGDVLLEMTDRSGARNGQHRRRPSQEPREGHLRGCRSMTRSKLPERAIVRDVPNRPPGQEDQ